MMREKRDGTHCELPVTELRCRNCDGHNALTTAITGEGTTMENGQNTAITGSTIHDHTYNTDAYYIALSAFRTFV